MEENNNKQHEKLQLYTNKEIWRKKPIFWLV